VTPGSACSTYLSGSVLHAARNVASAIMTNLQDHPWGLWITMASSS
jgi:hypothetical protein